MGVRRTAVVVALVVGTGFASSLTSVAQSDDLSAADEMSLQNIARDYLEERAGRVTVGYKQNRNSFSMARVNPSLHVRLTREFANIDELRARYADADLSYTSAKVALSFGEIDLVNNRAEVKIRETTSLYRGDSPVEYALDHELAFTRSTVDWRLDAAELAGGDGVAAPMQTQGEWNQDWHAKDVESLPDIEEIPAAPQDVNESGSYVATDDKGKMARYARKYALSSNDNYRTYDNDCTNFVSQAVRAGGWRMVNSSYDRDDNRRWNYGRFTWTTSYTWAGAHNFYRFGAWSNRTNSTNSGKLRVGDIVHIRFSGATRIGHTMMVTLYASGSPLRHPKLSYHTINTRNRPLRDIQVQYPPSKHKYYYRKTRG